MANFGYKLMSEEHGPKALVANARRAEELGFDFVAISDHYHPWLEPQGHSPLAWTVLGAVAARTERIGLTTAVTCPTIRYHPAVVAQFASTLAVLSNDRFTLGLGAGENLNEHVVGEEFPPPLTRQAMLGEAVDMIQLLWEGKEVSHRGEYFSLDRARLWDRPNTPLKLAKAAGGPNAAELAAQKGAGLFTSGPSKDLLIVWSLAGGRGPRYAEVMLSWAPTEAEAVRIAHERARFGVMGWKVMAELPTTASFEDATQFIRPEDVAKNVACGPDPERHLEAIQKYVDAGFDNLTLLAVGPDQDGFLDFWRKELGPRVQKLK